MMLQPWMMTGDLAPGDKKCLDRDWSDVTLHRISSPDDPKFLPAYQRLWSQFGALGEMEQESVIRERLAWDDSCMAGGCALRYRLMLVTAGEDIAAVRDHTAIVSEMAKGAVVHMSHNLVDTAWRRSGLGGWMRALPIQTARHALASQHRSEPGPITLVGEMEPPDPANPDTMIRLSAYEKAGFLKADPAVISYFQPDFRSPSEIDADGMVRPIPLQLIIHRVGRENETVVDASEIRHIAESLYRMYARGFREQDMQAAHRTLEAYPPAGTPVKLIPPTQ